MASVPIEVRSQKEPIPVIVLLEQEQLDIGTDPGLQASANPYGPVGALIGSAINSGANKQARSEFSATLDTLRSFDAKAPLIKGIRQGIADIPWVRHDAQVVSSKGAALTALTTSNAQYVSYVDCLYRIGQVFEALYARCVARVMSKEALSQFINGRRLRDKLLFQRAVETQTVLHSDETRYPFHDCYDKKRRALCMEQWTNDSAERLTGELTLSLEKIGSLVGKSLLIGPVEAGAATGMQDRFVHIAPLHTGFALEGMNNVRSVGAKHGMWSGFKPAVIIPESDGVLLLKEDGTLHHKRAIARR